jgi:ribosomal protein S18 acetylase RimI-like enzyme
MPTISVRRFTADEWRTYRALRLRALKDSPDAYGSTLDREMALTDSDWSTRLADGVAAPRALPLIALVDGTPAALTWGRVNDDEPEVAHVYQVWVAAEHRGRGIGRLLMEAVIAWARESRLHAVLLDVTADNAAAVQLYRRLGFVEVGDTEPLREGSTLRRQAMQLVLDAGRSTIRAAADVKAGE